MSHTLTDKEILTTRRVGDRVPPHSDDVIHRPDTESCIARITLHGCRSTDTQALNRDHGKQQKRQACTL